MSTGRRSCPISCASCRAREAAGDPGDCVSPPTYPQSSAQSRSSAEPTTCREAKLHVDRLGGRRCAWMPPHSALGGPRACPPATSPSPTTQHFEGVGIVSSRGHYRLPSWTGTAPLDASSGEHDRHRPSRAGNRRVNHVIHIAAVTQPLRLDSDGRAYHRRKRAEGKKPWKHCAAFGCGWTRRRRGANHAGARPTRRSSRCRSGRTRSPAGRPARAQPACRVWRRRAAEVASRS